MLKGLAMQRLVALFIGGALGFNFPLLALWDGNALLWGVPLFPAALFIVWALLIALLAFTIERVDESAQAAPRSPEGVEKPGSGASLPRDPP